MDILNIIDSQKSSLTNKRRSGSEYSENTTAAAVPVYYTPAPTVIANPFERLDAELKEIKMMLRLLLEGQNKVVEQSELIDLNEASEMLNISKSTIYKMTANKKIPFIKREGSTKLIFSRTDLEAWVKDSAVKSGNLVEEYLRKNLRVRKAQHN